jgi:hypothetical protein
MIYAILFSYFLYFTIVEQHHAVEEEMINAELMRARSISAAISEHLFDEDKAFLQNFVEHALGSSDVKYIMFIDREGNVLAEGGLPLDHMVQLAKGGPIVNEVGVSRWDFFTHPAMTYISARPLPMMANMWVRSTG